MKLTCRNCAYSRPGTDDTFVICQRYPPTITKIVGDAVSSTFPLLSSEAWCGEWRSKMSLEEELPIGLRRQRS